MRLERYFQRGRQIGRAAIKIIKKKIFFKTQITRGGGLKQETRETQRLLEMAKKTNEKSGTPEGPKSSDGCNAAAVSITVHAHYM